MADLIPPFGRVFLGPTGALVQFTTDPEPYSPYLWPKRFSVHPGIGGAVTIQDFGVFAKDRRVNLRGGDPNSWMDQEVVRAMDEFFRTKAGLFNFTDFLLNDFTVFIESFTHKPHPNLVISEYEMVLHVLTINLLFGATYTGT